MFVLIAPVNRILMRLPNFHELRSSVAVVESLLEAHAVVVVAGCQRGRGLQSRRLIFIVLCHVVTHLPLIVLRGLQFVNVHKIVDLGGREWPTVPGRVVGTLYLLPVAILLGNLLKLVVWNEHITCVLTIPVIVLGTNFLCFF